MYTLTRLCSTNYQQNYGIGLRTSLGGYPEFYNLSSSLQSSDNIQFIFTLAGVQVLFNGAAGFTAAMPGFSDMSGLFDNYMISQIDVMAIATWDGNQVSGNNVVGQLPYIVHAFDVDDAAATAASAMMQKTGAKFTQIASSGPNPIMLRKIYPAQASMVYNTLTTTAYTPKRGFVDMANTAVPHYGYKLALDNTYKAAAATSTDIGSINFIFRYHIKLRYTL